ncbi:MAG: sel1 repeat family protein [Loktanella sp.]|nr:sel1 repeat family protein [Loktanella sp.]
MRSNLSRLVLGAAVICGSAIAAVSLYHTKTGLSLRAQVGQTSGAFLHALSLYEDNRIGQALTTIAPLVRDGHASSLNLICGFVQSYEPVAATEMECVTVLESRADQRLISLTDIAIWAQEWDAGSQLIAQRLNLGDLTAHFDRARLIYAAESGRFDPTDLATAIENARLAEDPRGQYAAVVSTLNAQADGALSPVLAETLARRPKMTASDAYFELAKLIQTGAVSSSLSYTEVLNRADATGNPHAARYLAQYYLANPSHDIDGTQTQTWLAKAAQADDPVAQYNLAVSILNSAEPAKTIQQAIVLLDLAAAAGFVPAKNMLGATLWQNPDLLADDPAQVRASALRLMEEAALANDVNALFNMGNIHLFLQDLPKAMDYLTKAAALGSEPARGMLEQFGASAD